MTNPILEKWDALINAPTTGGTGAPAPAATSAPPTPRKSARSTGPVDGVTLSSAATSDGLPDAATRSLTESDRAALLAAKHNFETALAQAPPGMQQTINEGADQIYHTKLAAYLKQNPGSTEQDYLGYGHPPADFYRTAAAIDAGTDAASGLNGSMTNHALAGQPIDNDRAQQNIYNTLVGQSTAYQADLERAAQYTAAHPQ